MSAYTGSTSNTWYTTTGNYYYDNSSGSNWNTITIQQPTVTVPDYDFFFKMIEEMLKNDNPDKWLIDRYFLLLKKLEMVLEEKNNPLGWSEQGIKKILRCKSIEELEEFMQPPELEDFEEEFGPFKLDEKSEE